MMSVLFLISSVYEMHHYRSAFTILYIIEKVLLYVVKWNDDVMKEILL